jgi:hypothetical protein
MNLIYPLKLLYVFSYCQEHYRLSGESSRITMIMVFISKVVMANGIVTGTGGTLITTGRYKPEPSNTNLAYTKADISGSLLYSSL